MEKGTVNMQNHRRTTSIKVNKVVQLCHMSCNKPGFNNYRSAINCVVFALKNLDSCLLILKLNNRIAFLHSKHRNIIMFSDYQTYAIVSTDYMAQAAELRKTI